MITIKTPLTKDAIAKLKAGDEVLLSGIIFTARDAAHRKLYDLIKRQSRIPINLKDAVIYYCGPAPARPHKAIGTSTWLSADGEQSRSAGSCGPTTSSRMDEFTPSLLKLGLSGMIGKGDRSSHVRSAIKKYKCIYFLAAGGIGALLATKVKAARPILFKELGPEAIYKLEVKDFPLIVGIDSKGRDIYDKAEWKSR